MRARRFPAFTAALLSTLALLAAATNAGAQAAPARKPNILLIVADDLGWNAVGYHDGFAKTPTIDRLAARGVQLDRFYVSPMCSPTRAGLLTGRYPMRFGMARSVVRPWARMGLPPEERTLPEALEGAGYAHRAAFGKWHLGHLDPKWHPLAQGFTRFAGCYNGAVDYFTRERDGQPDWHEDYADVERPGYITDLIADNAAAFVRDHAKDPTPFFCYVAFTAPHDPLQAPQPYIDRYAHLDDTPGDGKPSDKQLLAAMITAMDDGIGRILKAVDDAGIANDTLVFFMSDNGGVRPIPGNNTPLRAGKLTCYEGGVRVPAVAHWPGHITGGRTITDPIVNVDLLPTLLALAGGKPDAPAGPLDGRDVAPLFTGQGTPAPRRDIYCFTAQSGPDDEHLAVITPDDHKLIIVGPDLRRSNGTATPQHRVELYNLATDPLEKTDLAAKDPGRVKALTQKLLAFRQSEPENAVGAPNRKPPRFEPPAKWHNAPSPSPKSP